jgi:transcriptional regulator with XRE-family HTH domain
MATQIEPQDTHKAIAEARFGQKLSMRAFAEALSVSQNAVYQWERGIAEPTNERLAEWLKDERAWVLELGKRLFSIKYGAMLASATTETPKAT